ncbi:MAG: LPS-assembly protein LptD [Gammaproteobacteria bacterium]|nr:LPS-assembly protein LptD [Gammaproteobacteria bacterium]
MLVDAEGALIEQNENRILLQGGVEVLQDESLLEADSVSYARDSETMDASGNVYLERPGLRLSAERGHFELATDQGELEGVSYRLSDRGARGNARSADIKSKQLTHFKEIDYTTCRPGENSWQLQAEHLEIDRESGTGTAHHAKVRFMGVPFLYLPYATFPIDDRRKSGFLYPSFGHSDRNGADVSIPYYFNIAPNFDATLTPRVLSKRGAMLAGEFRYLLPSHEGEVRAEILPDDREVEDRTNSTRGAFSTLGSGDLRPGWNYRFDINYASDNDYLDDLGDSLAVTSARHLERVGVLSYQGDDWKLTGMTQYYQTIDDTISLSSRPYHRLPQLLFELNKPRQHYGLNYHLRSEYVRFDHSDDNKVQGHRFDLQPGVSLPLTRSWGFLTPRASLRYTRYALENQGAGLADDPDRVLPTLSLDGGLFFDRSGSWLGEAITQTLEPRLFYLYTPHDDQSEIPNFDSSAASFNFSSLFRDNRFNGSDRVGDANQLTAALTTRIISDASGSERLRLSIGQIFYFRDREVQLSGSTVNEESSSSLAAELSANPSDNWRFSAGLQWDPHASNDQVERGSFSMRYNDDSERLFNLGYYYTRDSVDQTDLSTRWPLGSRWSMVGRWTYSHLYQETTRAFAGLEYDSCCWRVRLIGQQLLTDVEDDPVNSILVQFQLKGLGGWGRADDQFLEDNIAGYRANR